MAVTDIKDADLDSLIKKFPLVLVDFWAPWCGPCRTQGPILDSVANSMANSSDVKILKINVDENQEKATTYSVMSIPTIILFKDGKVVSKLTGIQSEAKLQALLDEHLDN